MQLTDLPTGSNRPAVSPKRRERGFRRYWLYLLAAFVVGLDQLVKYWAEQTLAPANSGRSIELFGGLFRFIFIKNSGASFGMFKNIPWFFALLAIAASIAIAIYYETQPVFEWGLKLGLGLILGGVVGNLVDRLFKGGSVTDMLNFPNFELFRVFNLADTAITFGVISLLLTFIYKAAQEQRAEKAAQKGD